VTEAVVPQVNIFSENFRIETRPWASASDLHQQCVGKSEQDRSQYTVGVVAPNHDPAIEAFEHLTEPCFRNFCTGSPPWVSATDLPPQHDPTAGHDLCGCDSVREVINPVGGISKSPKSWLSASSVRRALRFSNSSKSPLFAAAVRPDASFRKSTKSWFSPAALGRSAIKKSTNWFSAAGLSLTRRPSSDAEQGAAHMDTHSLANAVDDSVGGLMMPLDFLVVNCVGALIYDCPELVRVVGKLPCGTVFTGVEARASSDSVNVRFQCESVSSWVAVSEGAVHLVFYRAMQLSNSSRISYDV